MAYTPTTWNNGDVITAEKMNKLEKAVQNEQIGPQGPQGPAGAKGEKGIRGRGDLQDQAILFQQRIKQLLEE